MICFLFISFGSKEYAIPFNIPQTKKYQELIKTNQKATTSSLSLSQKSHIQFGDKETNSKLTWLYMDSSHLRYIFLFTIYKALSPTLSCLIYPHNSSVQGRKESDSLKWLSKHAQQLLCPFSRCRENSEVLDATSAEHLLPTRQCVGVGRPSIIQTTCSHGSVNWQSWDLSLALPPQDLEAGPRELAPLTRGEM